MRKKSLNGLDKNVTKLLAPKLKDSPLTHGQMTLLKECSWHHLVRDVIAILLASLVIADVILSSLMSL